MAHPSLAWTNLWRSALFVLIVVVDMGLFWLISYSLTPGEGASLRCAVDDWIPFIPWTVFLYSAVYTASAYPLFAIRCPRLFMRTVVAILIILAVHLVFFSLFPVAGWDFRPDVSQWPSDSFVTWGVRLTFFVDPPTNLFPSQHVSMAVIAMLVAWRASRTAGLALLPVVAGICISITTMKQHYLVDGLAGCLLAGMVYWLVVHPYDDQGGKPEEIGFSWRGPAAYYLFLMVVYGLFFALYSSGFRPWEAA